MAKNERDRQHQWNVIVDEKLDKLAREKAEEAGMNLSAWLRGVVRGHLDLPGGLK